MKKILVAAGLLMCASTASAAGPVATAIANNGFLGGLITFGGPFLQPVLGPVLSLTGGPAGGFVATFVPVGTTVISNLGSGPVGFLYTLGGRFPVPLLGLE